MSPASLSTFVAVTAALTAGIALWLARAAWRQRPAIGATVLTWLTLSVAVWASGKVLMVLAADLALCNLAAKYMVFGIIATPVLLFTFVLVYTGFDQRLSRGAGFRQRAWLALWIIPALTLAAAWSYPWLRLHWAAYQPSPQGCSVTTYGAWFYVHTLYDSALLVLSVLILSWYAFAVRGVYRQTALMVAAALVAPLPLALGFALRFPVATPVDWSYLGLLLSSTVLLIAVKRRAFLEMRPIAVDQLLEQIADAILVIDARLRIVDCNQAARADLGTQAAPLGRPLPDVLVRLLEHDSPVDSADRGSVAQLLELLQNEGSGDGDLVLTQPTLRHYHWRLSRLEMRDGGPHTGWILVWRDVTPERLKLAMLYEQERALALLVERQHEEAELALQLRATLAQVCRLGNRALTAFEEGDPANGAAGLARLLAAVGPPGAPMTPPPSDGNFHDVGVEATFLDGVTAFLQEYAHVATLPVTFTCVDPAIPSLLSPWMLVQLVRILQELLDGIRQTTPCQALHISLTADTAWVKLTVTAVCNTAPDDTPTPAGGLLAWLGNSSVPRRLAAVAGQYDVTSDPFTQVDVRLPSALAQRSANLRGRRVLVGGHASMPPAPFAEALQAQGMDVIGIALTTEELVAQVRTVKPELVLVDVSLLGPSLSMTLRRLRRSATDGCTIVLLAPAAEVEPGSAIHSGADGYIITTFPDERFVAALADLLAAGVAGELLASTLPTAATGSGRTAESLRLGLTDRQQEILTLIVRGFTYREIAAQLYVSERTVRYDASEIRKRIGVTHRSAMVEFAIEHDLVRGAAGIESAVR